ncbi:MAG: hypothetical protein QXY45_01870 [Candidatus Aenigmatarchaeota archaeon]
MLKGILNTLNLKSKSKIDRAEGFAILSILSGGVILSLGIGLSILNPKGISAILAMLGAFLTFISTISLIFVWLIRELKSD